MVDRLSKWVAVSLALSVVPVVACKKEQPAEPAAPTPSVAATTAPPAASAPAPSATAVASAAPLKGNMAHCPSTVEGAKTDVKDTPKGVEVVVTGTGAAVDEIRTRAKFLAQTAKDTSPEVKHNGSGEGSGAIGRCPVVLHKTALELTIVEGGAKLAVTPSDAKELDWLRRETRSRAKELSTAHLADYGQGKMANCPSAIAGAKTAVKETKDSVEITITGSDPKLTADIRSRAAKLVESAKNDPAEPKHTGGGMGGGGMGNCPVVLKDTKVESKEVPGGALVTIRPVKASDLPALKKEVAHRNENLAKALSTAP